MAETIAIRALSTNAFVQIHKKDFFGALEQSDPVNNIIEINGRQFILSSVSFDTPIPYPNTLFVDPVNGNDFTAQRGSFINRYQSSVSAIADAQPADRIIFMPGIYGDVGNLFKPFVVIHVEDGAIFGNVTFNDSAFIGTSCQNFVTGYLTCFSGGKLFDLTNPLTEFYLQGNEFVAFGGQPMRANQIKYLWVRFRKLDSRFYRGLRILNTECDIEMDEFDGTQIAVNSYNVDVEGMASKKHYIKIKKHKSISDSSVVCYEDNNAFTGKFIYQGDIEHIHPNPTGGISNCINVIYGGNMELKNCHVKTNTTALWQVDNLGNGTKGAIVINNCVIDATSGINPAIKTSSVDRIMFVKDSIIKAKSTRGAIEFGIVNSYADQPNGNLEIHNSKIINYDNGSAQNVLNIGGGVPVLNNVIFENGNPAGKSIAAVDPQNIKILSGGAGGNVPNEGTITNIVTGTSFIADSNLIGNIDIN